MSSWTQLSCELIQQFDADHAREGEGEREGRKEGESREWKKNSV